MLNELINQICNNILQTILVLVFSYIGLAIKNLNKKYVNTEIKKIIVKDCVKFVEQVYTDVHGDSKKAACEDKIVQLLDEKGITITPTELNVMIEAAVRELNRVKTQGTIGFKK